MEAFDKVIASVLIINIAALYLIKTTGNIISILSVAGTGVLGKGYLLYCVLKAALDR